MTAPRRSRLLGTGHYLPARVLSNSDLERMVDTSDAWIVERTGIRERRIAAEGECSSDMAAEAARRALESAGLKPADIDLLLVGTISADHPMPSCAALVQKKLGMRNVLCVDLSAACAGWLYGLEIADQYVRTGKARRVLVVGVELLSRVLDWTDRVTCVLFGDGAGAAVLGPQEEGETGALLGTHCFLDGGLAGALCIPAGGSARPASHATVDAREHYVKMQGQEIFKSAVKNLASSCKVALEEAKLTAAEVDWVVPHQANLRILQGVSDRVGVPMARFYINLDRVGNTSSASVPIALDEASRAGLLKPGQVVLCCALGAGIAWGSALFRWG
ncbi:MAG: ketoacyl-ACP synthase III [Deltaproteobacteria bacterium]|nr:ketoacyl-ACP synthase III [Deltaproteobacteria bacterium]